MKTLMRCERVVNISPNDKPKFEVTFVPCDNSGSCRSLVMHISESTYYPGQKYTMACEMVPEGK